MSRRCSRCFGPGGTELAASSDPATARQNRDVFVVAMKEGWRLASKGPTRKELDPRQRGVAVPRAHREDAQGVGVRYAKAGKEEVLIRRIGRNELAAIRIAKTYVAAQHAYARRTHDGKPAGSYARRFASGPGTENGLYWPIRKGEPNSPLGALVAEAAGEGRQVGDGQRPPVPFHGYYFKMLEAQSARAPGGARNYVADGVMSGGFALVAWPAAYDVTGIMTFIVNQDGVVLEKDLGAETADPRAQDRRVQPRRDLGARAKPGLNPHFWNRASAPVATLVEQGFSPVRSSEDPRPPNTTTHLS